MAKQLVTFAAVCPETEKGQAVPAVRAMAIRTVVSLIAVGVAMTATLGVRS